VAAGPPRRARLPRLDRPEGAAALGEEIVAEPVGVELRLADSTGPARTTLCDWCRTDDGTSTARLVVARRAGPRGRAGDTVGQYVCGDLACWTRVRRPLKAHEKSVTGAPDLRVDDLRRRVLEFVDRVRAG
jgi:antitoxin (DNA-binding transcriptional repressor) of toxin-antitoxin stability system